MTPQDHANHLLYIWQQNRTLPPERRIVVLDRPLHPMRSPRTDDHPFDRILARIDEAMAEGER